MAEPLLELFDPNKVETLNSQQIREALKSLLRGRLADFQEEKERLDEERN